MYDAVVVGSGPNGLAAAIELARGGASVHVIEAADTFGGGLRSGELTLPGFVHDHCSAVHTLGVLSPFFRTLPLEQHGLKWLRPQASAAHPLDDAPATMLYKSLERTAENLDEDGRAWMNTFAPLLENSHGLLADILGPLSIPRHPFLMARFGLPGLVSAARFARTKFRGARARALFAGCAAHSILPLDFAATAAVGELFALAAHIDDWPVAAGGSQSIADALVSYLRSLGGTLTAGARIAHLRELPDARAYLFDTDPLQLIAIAESVLPSGYVAKLRRFRFGPGVFKIDYALDGPIPWRDPRCLEASTVHVGGTLDEIAASERAAWNGEHADAPFVMVCQQSQFDPSRAPAGKHTGYAYCHVPGGSTRDMTDAIEKQFDRFAPGFRDHVLARHVTSPADLERRNPNYVGGAIAGGAANLPQLFTRPVVRWNPYITPHPRLFLCSASTPPGGGVHGMCGYHAAVAARKRMAGIRPEPLR